MNRSPTAQRFRYAGMVVWLLLPSLLFAGGRTEEDEFQRIDGSGNWEHTIDVSELEPGQYNILVRARDEAGNETIGGPYNIFVDPESDLPQLAVSYPQPMQSTGKDLFVVGSSWDDDGVSHVEVKVNESSFRRAEGDRYWSLRVPLAALEDGAHTVTARAVDVNGVTGPETTVPFRLDRTGPRLSISSHESGVLVTGRTTVEGTVGDENGVETLALVRSDGRERLDLRGAEGQARRFSFQIDPRRMEEGPSVWWLESTDGTGSVGVAPFLFFVDTSAPELEVLYPGADDRVDAQLRVAGRARDMVGIDSLTYELSNGEGGEIPLRPGDPFWTLSVDLPPETRGNVMLTLRAVDLAGNVAEQRVRYPIDRPGDEPVVQLIGPSSGQFEADPRLAGHVADDDGPAQIIYSLNGAPPVSLKASTAFSVPLEAAVFGANEIEVYAVDQHGLPGPVVRRRFLRATPLPVIMLETVTRAESSAEYTPGFAVEANERVSLSGALVGESNGLPDRIAFAVNGQVSSAAIGEGGGFTIPLPRGREAAAQRVDLWYTNELGLTTRTTGYYIQLPASGAEAPVPDLDSLVESGIHLTIGALPEGEGVPPLGDVPLTVTRSAPLRLGVSGGRISNLALEPPVDYLSVRAAGNQITISATGDGYAPSVRVTGTIDGRAVRSAPLSIRTETASPQLQVSGIATGDHRSRGSDITISALDSSGVSLVRAGFSLVDSEGPAQLSPLTLQDDVYTFGGALPREDGPAVLRVEAQDRAGAVGVLEIPVTIDRSAPTATLVAPVDGETVNGTVSVVAIVDQYGTLAEAAAYDPPGSVLSSLAADRMLVFPFALSAGDPAVGFLLTDLAGNESRVEATLLTDDSADQPQLTVQIPSDGGVVVDQFRLSGVLLDDDKPVALEYTINEGEPVRRQASGPFDLSVDMSDLADGTHTLHVTGFDLEGVASEPVKRTFMVSRTAPLVTLEAPGIETYQRGVVLLSGTASDPNGVGSVEISVDGAASWQRARGMEQWRYALDSSLMDDGTHSLLIRATDTAGMATLLTTTINVDNTEPLLELALPEDGESSSGRFLIDGRAADAAFDQIRLVLQSLGDAGEQIELAQFTTPGPFAYRVDTAELPAGWYNLRVEASDLAGNARQISRNLRVELEDQVEMPQLILPKDGALLAGDVTVVVRAPADLDSVPLYVDDQLVTTVGLDGEGRGATVLSADSLRDGEVTLSLEPPAGAEPVVTRAAHTIRYRREGAWVQISGPGFDSYVRDRPFLTGSAGYVLTLPEGDDAETRQEQQRLLREHAVTSVEVSTDNGQTWTTAHGTDEWRHRIETTELPDGAVHYVVRAVFANGENAATRHTVIVDEQPPTVRLLAPSERDTFDKRVRVVGSTMDENALADVAILLRPGDKASYELPGFIQGLYLDVHALGATYFDVGAGLSFFDNNVRLQAQIGVSPPGRFSGLVIGTKLLANIATLPASFFLGPDYEWLGAALALGANFSYFTMSDDSIAFTDEGVVLAGMVAQLEFPVITLQDLAVFNTYSLYTEYQLWFISSDVQAGVSGRLAFGLRLNVF